MTLPDLVGTSFVECFTNWQQDTAILLLKPEENIPDLLVDLNGLLKLRLVRGKTGGAKIQRVNGPTKTEAGWRLCLEFACSGLLEAEYTSLEFRRGARGQRWVSDTDLYEKIREMLRTTMHALVRGDLHAVQRLPRIASIKTLPYEVHEYPKNLVDPPPEAFTDFAVGPVGSYGGRWRIAMPLWTREGRLGSYNLSMQVHQVDDNLVGYLEGVFTQ